MEKAYVLPLFIAIFLSSMIGVVFDRALIAYDNQHKVCFSYGGS